MNPYSCVEPQAVYPEKEFEKALASVIQDTLPGDVASVIVPRCGFDFAVFVQLPSDSRVVFLEVKAYGGQRQGGVGFGNADGKGPQVDLLLCSVDQLPILDRHVRWAFADETQPPGATRYAFLTCSEARNAAMGGVARGKQNNFRISALKAHNIAWPALCDKLVAFLSGTIIS